MAGSITGRVANGGVPWDCGGALPGTCSGFKVFVDGRHIQHHILPVGPLRPHHLINVQSGFDADTFRCLERQGEVPSLILTVQFLIRNVGRKVCVQQCTEGQTIIPAAAEVCNVNILITFCFLLTPLQQSIPL